MKKYTTVSIMYDGKTNTLSSVLQEHGSLEAAISFRDECHLLLSKEIGGIRLLYISVGEYTV